MMNAGQKRASISATLIFADLRQVTNEIDEAHQYSILADDIQQDRLFAAPRVFEEGHAGIETGCSNRPAERTLLFV